MRALLLLWVAAAASLPAEYEAPALLSDASCPAPSCAASFATSLSTRSGQTISACYLARCAQGDAVADVVATLLSRADLVPAARYTGGECSAAVGEAALGALRVANVYTLKDDDLAYSMAEEVLTRGPVVTYDGAQCVVVYGWRSDLQWLVLRANGTRGSEVVRNSTLQRRWWAFDVATRQAPPAVVDQQGWQRPSQVLTITILASLLLLLVVPLRFR